MAPPSLTSSAQDVDTKSAVHHVPESPADAGESNLSGVDEKALLRKMDWALVPWVSRVLAADNQMLNSYPLV